MPDEVEFAQFESQIDEKGNKISSKYEHELFDYLALNQDDCSSSTAITLSEKSIWISPPKFHMVSLNEVYSTK